jgi:hypothetical protein
MSPRFRLVGVEIERDKVEEIGLRILCMNFSRGRFNDQ